MFTLLKWYLTFWGCFWKALKTQEALSDKYFRRDKNTTYKESWYVFTNFKLKKDPKQSNKVNTMRSLPVINTLIQCMFGLYEVLLHGSITEQGKDVIFPLS